jgi:hypothetical protein
MGWQIASLSLRWKYLSNLQKDRHSGYGGGGGNRIVNVQRLAISMLTMIRTRYNILV